MHEKGLHDSGRARRETATAWFIGAVVLVTISLSALISLQLLSLLVELICVVIACAIFSVVWHSRGFSDTPFFLFLGTGLLGIAGLWALHALAGIGMFDVLGDGRRISRGMGLEARLLEAAMFCVAPFFVGRNPRASLMLVASVIVAGAAAALAFSTARGNAVEVTALLPISASIVCALLASAMILLSMKRNGFDKKVFVLLLVSLATRFVADICQAISPTDESWLALAGLFFRLAAVFVLFRAVVSTALENPYRLLFYGMRPAGSELAVSEEKALKGILSICMSCKKIKVSDDSWEQIESYISAHTHVEFSHGICPDCAQKVFADMAHDGTA